MEFADGEEYEHWTHIERRVPFQVSPFDKVHLGILSWHMTPLKKKFIFWSAWVSSSNIIIFGLDNQKNKRKQMNKQEGKVCKSALKLNSTSELTFGMFVLGIVFLVFEPTKRVVFLNSTSPPLPAPTRFPILSNTTLLVFGMAFVSVNHCSSFNYSMFHVCVALLNAPHRIGVSFVSSSLVFGKYKPSGWLNDSRDTTSTQLKAKQNKYVTYSRKLKLWCTLRSADKCVDRDFRKSFEKEQLSRTSLHKQNLLICFPHFEL